jgi:hypothetical protein
MTTKLQVWEVVDGEPRARSVLVSSSAVTRVADEAPGRTLLGIANAGADAQPIYLGGEAPTIDDKICVAPGQALVLGGDSRPTASLFAIAEEPPRHAEPNAAEAGDDCEEVYDEW